jgi:phosphoribosylaminoimidazole-succinocarboxamide synthase
MMDRAQIEAAIPNCLTASALPLPGLRTGKVRDTYTIDDDRLLLITTDRQSGFDRYLGAVPFKGQVLNQTSLFWFHATQHIIANHVLASPHANALIARACTVFPVEFVVRGYMTGSTDTAIWTQYNAGVRSFCGHALPEGLRKNDALPANIVTPTTKDAAHDRPITAHEVVAQGLMTQQQWDYTHSRALALFAFGQQQAAARGLILVDTKYEFGLAPDGTILLIDEVHTPDSSRFWIADTYTARHAAGEEPDMVDKEFFRLWFRERCDPYKDAVLPEAPASLVAELSLRYMQLYEQLTGAAFAPDIRPLEATIMEALAR